MILFAAKNCFVRLLLRVAAGCCALLATSGFVGFAQVEPQTKRDGELSDKSVNYRVGPGDVLDISVGRIAQLSQNAVRVGNNGAIRLAMLDEEIAAACQTEKDLAQAIAAKYKKYVLNPSVSVAVKEFNANPVALIGAVNNPGRFQLQRPIRLLEILTFVNGPSVAAGESVQIIRNQNLPRCVNGVLVVAESTNAIEDVTSYNLSDVLQGAEKSNPLVQAGDIVLVSEAQLKQAFVIGNVKTAQTINLKEPTTLTKAIAMAGGTTGGAQIEKIKISRQTAGALDKTELIVNLKEISKRSRADVLLEPNDIVEVPGPSGGKKILRDVLRVATPAILRVPIIP